MRQLTLEAQREFMLRRGGFSQNHPFISGEVHVHPELQGRLPFADTRTIPMRPDDYQRFKPELWLHHPHHHPQHPVAFNDIAVLQNELELRRRREVHRQNSQRMLPQQNSPPPPPDGSSGGGGDSFKSLPWEDIVLNRDPAFYPTSNNTFPAPDHLFREHFNKEEKRNGGGGWFNPRNVFKSSSKDKEETTVHDSNRQQWLLKEKSTDLHHHHHHHMAQQLKSMPPTVGDTLVDSGIGADDPHNRSGSGSGNLSRTGTGRSSFGIILRDKFQKNPNVYFPKSGGDDENDGSSHSAASSKKRTRRNSEDEDDAEEDALIHNISEGSFEKQNSHSGSLPFSNNSSGNSSLSPHNSMEGSPRMISRTEPENNVIMGKKTIR